jgi:heme/copper-type cytochrome/quinol oxidase subunit 4
MPRVPDAVAALVAAAADAGRIALLLAIQAAVALTVFVHATRTGNRYAPLWGLGTLVFIAVGLIYAARVWWNAGGKR